MVYSNVVELRELSMDKLNKAMYNQSNVSLILNTALHDVGINSKWYLCSRLIMQGINHLLKHEECGVYVLQKAAGLLIEAKCLLGPELTVRSKDDIKILNKFKEAKTKEQLEEFRIPGIVESLFRNQVRYAAKSFGLCRDYLLLHETAWEAWIKLILNCESFNNCERYKYMVGRTYGVKLPALSIESGKSPARLTGMIVRACDVQKDSIIETDKGVRYYVQDRVNDEEGVRLYCVIDPREAEFDGLTLSTKNGFSKKEGWLYCSSLEVTLIGHNTEVAVMNERVRPNDIRRGDIVSIYGHAYIMQKDSLDGVYVFEGSGGEEMKMKKDDVIYNDNIVVTSNLRAATRRDMSTVIYRNGYVELNPNDIISYTYSQADTMHEGQVVFNTSHGAYGVVNGHIFLPLCMLHNIKKIK